MLNSKCLLCAVTDIFLSTAKVAIFVISSLQKAFFFDLKYAKTFTYTLCWNKNGFLGILAFLIM